MFTRSLQLLVLCALTFFLGQVARAESPSGTWHGDNGATFIIPLVQGNTFDMIVIQPTGQKELRHAQWVAGMEGTQFSYRLGNAVKTATFNGSNPDRMQLASSDGTPAVMWSRVRNPQFGWRGVLGTWRSTSGNVFVIADRGRTFDIILTAPNGAKQLLSASWIPGMEGTQFVYNVGAVRNVATRVPSDENQIRIEAGNGQANVWTRSN